MLVSNRDGVICLANGVAARMLGYREEEMPGLPMAALLPQKYLERLQSFLAHFWPEPESRPVESGPEFPLMHKDGREVWVQMGFNPVRIDGIVYALGTMLDLAERRRAEQAVRESEEKFSKAFRASPDAISVHEMETGRYVDVNQGFLQLFGYARADLIGRTPEELGIWIDLAERDTFVQLLHAQGSVRDFQARIRLRNGDIRVGQLSSEMVEIGGRSHNVTVLRDVTEKLRAERALR